MRLLKPIPPPPPRYWSKKMSVLLISHNVDLTNVANIDLMALSLQQINFLLEELLFGRFWGQNAHSLWYCKTYYSDWKTVPAQCQATGQHLSTPPKWSTTTE